MKNLYPALWVEFLKARRSKMPLLTAIGFSMIPLAGGFFMLVLKDPEMALRVGLISAKAQLTMGSAEWTNYLHFLSLAVGAGGIILFGFITSWVFGREYSDHTVTGLLALPTSRSTIVLSKIILITVWSVMLAGLVYILALCVGTLLELPQTAPQIFFQNAIKITTAVGLTILLTTPIALAASIWHGYLPPIGVMMLCMGLAQLANAAGWGEFFPWAVPALYVEGEELGAISYIIVFITGFLGLAFIFLWWERADQTN
jgi:ABC-2 type transport system permease protein